MKITNKVTKRIQEAIKNTRVVAPGYYEATCVQRSPKSGCGSVVTAFFGHEVYDGIGHLCFYDAWEGWQEYPNCPNLLPGCVAFRNNDLGGELGIVQISELDPDTKVTLDDRKGTGFISATVKGQRGKHVGFTVAILGQEQDREVLFTFHPGDPVIPSSVKAAGLHGKVITAKEALAMGLETAKIVSEVAQ